MDFRPSERWIGVRDLMSVRLLCWSVYEPCCGIPEGIPCIIGPRPLCIGTPSPGGGGCKGGADGLVGIPEAFPPELPVADERALAVLFRWKTPSKPTGSGKRFAVLSELDRDL